MKRIKKILHNKFLRDLFESKLVDLSHRINVYIESNNQIREINEENGTNFISTVNISQLPADFDAEIYLKLNPDVKKAKEDPKLHFLTYGIKEGRLWQLPVDFDDEIYLRLNPDVKKAKEDPKSHFLNHGIKEGRLWQLPVDFDDEIYLKLNPDIKKAGEDPAIHFLTYGIKEGRLWKLPADFDDQIYLRLNPDVKKAGEDPILHFLTYGLKEGRLWQLPVDFDDEIYLKLNPDIKKTGEDPAIHFLKYGLKEGRPWQKNRLSKRPKFATHENIWPWLGVNASKTGLKVLEIGSRSVVSDSIWKKYIPNCEYTGFDVSDGKNVDVVGDIHRLSDYFPVNHFDFIISFAVFEHLAMPWIAAEEINKVLKIGGHIVIETHFSFSEHELPWHYFQFNSNALEVLFCKELGFELIDSGLYNPILGEFTDEASEYLRGMKVRDLYCHSSIIAKKYKDFSVNEKNYNFSWRDAYKRISSESSYPLESDLLRKKKNQK